MFGSQDTTKQGIWEPCSQFWEPQHSKTRHLGAFGNGLEIPGVPRYCWRGPFFSFSAPSHLEGGGGHGIRLTRRAVGCLGLDAAIFRLKP
eukprot:5952103-Amphidinium_carterae.1